MGGGSLNGAADNIGIGYSTLNALTTGDLYFNTGSNNLRVYNGNIWEDAAISTSGFATTGLSIAMAVAL